MYLLSYRPLKDKAYIEYKKKLNHPRYGFTVYLKAEEQHHSSVAWNPTDTVSYPVQSDGSVGDYSYNSPSLPSFSWAFTKGGAETKAKRRVRRYLKKQERNEALKEVTGTEEIDLDSAVPLKKKTQTKFEGIPVSELAKISTPELERRLRFGRTLIDRPERYCDLDDVYGNGKLREPSDTRKANVVISKIAKDQHAFCVDIDMPCELVQSKTPGHYHLYIDKVLSSEVFFNLLDELAIAGIVESGYSKACRSQGTAILRLPPGEDSFEKLKRELEENPNQLVTLD